MAYHIAQRTNHIAGPRREHRGTLVLTTIVDHGWVVRYGVPADMPERLARDGVPLHLYWGRFDWLHSAQVDRWRAGRSPAEVTATVFPWMGHMQVCAGVDGLRLWDAPELWRASGEAVGSAVPRSRL